MLCTGRYNLTLYIKFRDSDGSGQMQIVLILNSTLNKQNSLVIRFVIYASTRLKKYLCTSGYPQIFKKK